MLIQKRIDGLDILRAIALFVVTLQHSFMFTDSYYPKLRAFWIISHAGLDIFFVLSGFLIANIFDKNQLTYKNTFFFYLKRWFKTLPMYFLVIGVCLLLSHLNVYYAKDFSISFFTFTQNLFKANFHFLPHTYSLTIEEWFYLLFPICIIIFGKLINYNKSFYATLAIWIMFAIVARIILNPDFENWDSEIRKSLISRIDAPTYGMLIYYLMKNNFEKIKKYKNVLFIIGLSSYFIFTFLLTKKISLLFNNVFYYTIIPISISLILPYFYFLNSYKKTINLFQKQSLASYSIYLIHLPLMHILKDYIVPKTRFESIMFLLLSIGSSYFIGFLFYKFYEKPIMNLRDKI